MMPSYSRNMLLTILVFAVFLSQGCAVNSAATTVPQPSSTETEPPENQPAMENAASRPLDLSQMNVEEWASTSSDGKWVAAGLVAFPKPNADVVQAYVRLVIFSADGKTHQVILDEWREIGLGFPSPAPLKWSQDNRSFYFTYRAIPDGCPVFIYLTDLQHVNLESGSVADVLPTQSVALALSPDNSQVAYSYFSGQPEMGLALRSLATGEVQETTLDPGKQFSAGNMVWSPDGGSFALTLAIEPCTGDHRLSRTVWAESTTILVVDAETLQQKILIEEDPRLFITVEWNEEDKIVITDGEENSQWHLDVNTGAITRP